MYKEIENLVSLSREGNKNAKEELLMKLKPLIISSIRRYYNNRSCYDDLIQEGYELLLKCVKEYDPLKGATFLGYTKTMLKFYYLNKHKEKIHLSLNERVGDGEDEMIDLLEAEEMEILDSIILEEEKNMLLDSLNCLTERQRQIVVYYYIEGKNIGEIAKILSISYRTVVNTKTIALNKLRKIIVKY